MASTIEKEIKKSNSRIFRRAYIKRRLATTGLFEDDWQEITNDVKKWGKVSTAVDATRPNVFKFSNVVMQLTNYAGKYNANDDQSSVWYGYAGQNRTLVKIEAGYLFQSLSANGIWTNIEYPTNSVVFTGVLSGDVPVSSQNDVQFTVRPLTQVFIDFPCKNLIGLPTGGMAASAFVELLRDQQDTNGVYIFRPFFGDTTTNWIISTTTANYGSLNPSQDNGVYSKNVWEIIEKLSEAEGFAPYANRYGQFIFGPKVADSATSFQFYGVGNFNTEYGHTVKKVNSYGKKYSSYYTRVELKFAEDDTSTSTVVKEIDFQVSGNNDAWINGQKTLKIENTWLNSTTAAVLVDTIFSEVSSLQNYINFTTTFVPHLELLSKTNLSFDSSEIDPLSLWDNNDWDVLTWDSSAGDPVKLISQEVKSLSVEIDLDKLESVFTGSEL